jgi:hypothetical protein
MLRKAVIGLAMTGASVTLGGCTGLLPSDPAVPDAGVRSDHGTLSIVLPRCAGVVVRVDVSSPPGSEVRLLWSGRVSGEPGQLVPLTEARAHVDDATPVQIEVFASDGLYVANWPGSKAPSYPAASDAVVVQSRTQPTSEFVNKSSACNR